MRSKNIAFRSRTGRDRAPLRHQPSRGQHVGEDLRVPFPDATGFRTGRVWQGRETLGRAERLSSESRRRSASAQGLLCASPRVMHIRLGSARSERERPLVSSRPLPSLVLLRGALQMRIQRTIGSARSVRQRCRTGRDLAPRWPAPAARLVNAAAAAGGHVRTILRGLEGDHPARGLLSSVPMTQDKKPNRTTVRLPATLRYGFLRMVPAA